MVVHRERGEITAVRYLDTLFKTTYFSHVVGDSSVLKLWVLGHFKCDMDLAHPIPKATLLAGFLNHTARTILQCPPQSTPNLPFGHLPFPERVPVAIINIQFDPCLCSFHIPPTDDHQALAPVAVGDPVTVGDQEAIIRISAELGEAGLDRFIAGQEEVVLARDAGGMRARHVVWAGWQDEDPDPCS
jgi:hypothetical protein